MNKNYIINNLINTLQKLPYIGQKSAKRMAIAILQNKEKYIKPLIKSLTEAYDSIEKCTLCGNLASNKICEICNNPTRDRQTICIVESIADLWAIEGSNSYRGLYHVLDGTLSAIEGRGTEVLFIDKLRSRIKENNIKEIIMATNANLDGQTTAFYISSCLEDLNLKITQPAYGLPIGSELNYLDESTLNIAFKNKQLL